MKICCMNEYDWVVAPDLEAAKAWYLEHSGYGDAGEAFGDGTYTYELTEKQATTLVYDDYSGHLADDGKPRVYSFAEALEIMRGWGMGEGDMPFHFASTEY